MSLHVLWPATSRHVVGLLRLQAGTHWHWHWAAGHLSRQWRQSHGMFAWRLHGRQREYWLPVKTGNNSIATPAPRVAAVAPVIWHGIRVGPKNMFRKLHMIGYALILSINRILSTCLSERGGAHPLSRMNFTCFVT